MGVGDEVLVGVGVGDADGVGAAVGSDPSMFGNSPLWFRIASTDDFENLARTASPLASVNGRYPSGNCPLSAPLTCPFVTM
jgi:hypothetical protein